MERREIVKRLNELLLEELPQYKKQACALRGDDALERRLLRSLMNLRPSNPACEEFLRLQDILLRQESQERGVVDVLALPSTTKPRIVLWKGDITRLKVDAIVNAANSALQGCFIPCHGCIDNAIHSAAGVQLRQECHRIMKQQGIPEATGHAKITPGYNLPSRYVLHTVGPIIQGALTEQDCNELAACYKSCLTLAVQNELTSVAFCCISTGEYHFPRQAAARIAIQTVADFLRTDEKIEKIVFNVFTEEDWFLYNDLLRHGHDKEKT